MQKCKSCGEEIKYIPTAKGVTVTCDAEEITVYTMNGRKVEGYRIHNCKGEKTIENKS